MISGVSRARRTPTSGTQTFPSVPLTVSGRAVLPSLAPSEELLQSIGRVGIISAPLLGLGRVVNAASPLFFHSHSQTSACGNNWGQEHRAPKARELDIGRSESQLEGVESWVLWSPHTAQMGQVFLAGNTEIQSFPVGFMVSDEMKLLGPFSIQ